MSLPSQLLRLALLCLSIVAAPAPARADNLHSRLYVGAAHLRNLHGSGRSSGLGVAAQFDLGVRLAQQLALHGSVIADKSHWMGFDTGISHSYETTLYGLGVGATANWHRLALGIATGAQLTWYPDRSDPSSGLAGHGGSGLGEHLGERFFDRNGLGPTRSSAAASGTSGTISSRRSASDARSSSLSFIASAKIRSTFVTVTHYTTASG